MAKRSSSDDSTKFGLRWKQFDRRDSIVTKERFFTTEKQRTAFVERITAGPSFHSIDAFSDPDPFNTGATRGK